MVIGGEEKAMGEVRVGIKLNFIHFCFANAESRMSHDKGRYMYINTTLFG